MESVRVQKTIPLELILYILCVSDSATDTHQLEKKVIDMCHVLRNHYAHKQVRFVSINPYYAYMRLHVLLLEIVRKIQKYPYLTKN